MLTESEYFHEFFSAKISEKDIDEFYDELNVFFQKTPKINENLLEEYALDFMYELDPDKKIHYMVHFIKLIERYSNGAISFRDIFTEIYRRYEYYLEARMSFFELKQYLFEYYCFIPNRDLDMKSVELIYDEKKDEEYIVYEIKHVIDDYNPETCSDEDWAIHEADVRGEPILVTKMKKSLYEIQTLFRDEYLSLMGDDDNTKRKILIALEKDLYIERDDGLNRKQKKAALCNTFRQVEKELGVKIEQNKNLSHLINKFCKKKYNERDQLLDSFFKKLSKIDMNYVVVDQDGYYYYPYIANIIYYAEETIAQIRSLKVMKSKYVELKYEIVKNKELSISVKIEGEKELFLFSESLYEKQVWHYTASRFASYYFLSYEDVRNIVKMIRYDNHNNYSSAMQKKLPAIQGVSDIKPLNKFLINITRNDIFKNIEREPKKVEMIY
jgi:hypothetical protein